MLAQLDAANMSTVALAEKGREDLLSGYCPEVGSDKRALVFFCTGWLPDGYRMKVDAVWACQ